MVKKDFNTAIDIMRGDIEALQKGKKVDLDRITAQNLQKFHFLQFYAQIDLYKPYNQTALVSVSIYHTLTYKGYTAPFKSII